MISERVLTFREAFRVFDGAHESELDQALLAALDEVERLKLRQLDRTAQDADLAAACVGRFKNHPRLRVLKEHSQFQEIREAASAELRTPR